MDSLVIGGAESTIGVYEAEPVRHRGPWRSLKDFELATLGWVDWFNHRRLTAPTPAASPAEAEDLHHRQPRSARQGETHDKQPA